MRRLLSPAFQFLAYTHTHTHKLPHTTEATVHRSESCLYIATPLLVIILHIQHRCRVPRVV